MTDQNLEEGDLVQPIAGGPVMSVQSLGDDRVVCIWFDGAGRLQEDSFASAALRRVDGEGS